MTTISTFFERTARLGVNPHLHKIRGTIRFEVRDADRTDHWLLTIDEGQLHAKQGWHEAQTVVTTDRPLAEELVEGKVNALAAIMRGDIVIQGDVPLALKFGRILPLSPEARGPQRPARSRAGH